MKKYTGIIIEESFEDNRILNEFSILSVKITNDEIPTERWHLFKIEVSKNQFEKLSHIIKPDKWYAHFWCGDEMVVVFRNKIFLQKINDKTTWKPAIKYGLSLGIPKEQLDFIIE